MSRCRCCFCKPLIDEGIPAAFCSADLDDDDDEELDDDLEDEI